MSRIRLIIVGGLSVMLTTAVGGGRQTAVTGPDSPAALEAPHHVISGGPTCRECRIQRWRAVTLTDSALEGGSLLNYSWIPARMSDGRFFISASSGNEVYLAAPTGEIVMQVGRLGAGPGEFKHPNPVRESAAAYYVFDGGNGRVTRLAKRDLSLIDTAPLPFWGGSTEWIVFPDGRFGTAQMTTRPPSAADQPIHIVTLQGDMLHSFGATDSTRALLRAAPDAPTRRRTLQRELATSGDSIIWAAHWDRYRIEKWDSAGALRAVYDRRVTWFPPRTAAESMGPIPLDRPRISRIEEGPDGHLWVFITTKKRERTQPLGVVDTDPFDTIVEVLDLRNSRVLAAGRVERWLGLPVRGGMYESFYRLSPRGEPLIDVWEYRMVRRR